MISILSQPSCVKRSKDFLDFSFSMLLGAISGSFLIPVLFPVWFAISMEEDFLKSCDDFGPRRKDIDHLLVSMLFAIWLLGIGFGYAYGNIPGAIFANMCIGAFPGALFGYWVHQPKSSM